MAFGCMFSMRPLMRDLGMLMFFSLLMEHSCVAPLTLVVMVTRAFIFQPSFLVSLCAMANFEYLS